MLTQYVKAAVDEVRTEIRGITGKEDEAAGAWSELENTGKWIASELSATVSLAGELSRLEMVDAGSESVSETGFAQTKIERFYSQYSKIPHPFDVGKRLELSRVELRRSRRGYCCT
jgi:hypothetical protein